MEPLVTTVVGYPKPVAQWFKDEKPLEHPESKRNGDTYTHKDTTSGNTAEYTVKAMNPLGSA